MTTVVDNFLPQSYYRKLYDVATSNTLPYYYQNSINNIEATEPADFGFNYWIQNEAGVVQNWLFMPLLYAIKDKFGVGDLRRARIDMTMYNPDAYAHAAHQDYTDNHFTAIYYLNDSDGPTNIYNETEPSDNYTFDKIVSPVANRLVGFNGKQMHAGYSPSKHQCRILINANYEPRSASS